jgi:hypothetical protein
MKRNCRTKLVVIKQFKVQCQNCFDFTKSKSSSLHSAPTKDLRRVGPFSGQKTRQYCWFGSRTCRGWQGCNVVVELDFSQIHGLKWLKVQFPRKLVFHRKIHDFVERLVQAFPNRDKNILALFARTCWYTKPKSSSLHGQNISVGTFSGQKTVNALSLFQDDKDALNVFHIIVNLLWFQSKSSSRHQQNISVALPIF